MKLEKYLAIGKNKYSFDIELKNDVIGTIDLFRQLDEKINKNPTEKEKADFAHSFVKTIVDKLTDLAIENAQKENIKNIGITGGVSYNIPIVEMVEKRIKQTDLNFVVHNNVPNGDGGIAIGQNVIIGHKIN
jgi:hydrogenase maturation protein HypF